jgi:hypothetical protein
MSAENSSKENETEALSQDAVICRIFRIGMYISSKGFVVRETEIYVKETKKSYLGFKTVISKSKIMKIDTTFYENHNSIRYFTYCLDGFQQEAKDLLKNHIIKKVNQYKSEIDVISSYI